MLDSTWIASRALATAWGGRLIIFTVSNGPYVPVGVTWHKGASSIGLARHAVIFAVDAAAACDLAANGLAAQTYLLGGRLPRYRGLEHAALSASSAWRCNSSLPAVRFRLLSALSRSREPRLDVLYSDADVEWLGSPLPALARVVGASAQPRGVATSHGSWPFELSQKWGATACTGVFFTYGALPASFWARLSLLYNRDGNDQVHFNHLMLDDLGVRWPRARLQYGRRSNASTDTALLCLSPTGGAGAVSVPPCAPNSSLPFTLLSFIEFPRMNCSSGHNRLGRERSVPPETTLLHCKTGTYMASSKHTDAGIKHAEGECLRQASLVDTSQRCRMDGLSEGER